jgi:O-antigen/teichoic acid export membrane protein
LLSISNIFKGHKRSVGIKKNIVASFLIKGVSIIIGFAMVPLCLEYLDQTKYGIWLTVSSIMVWFSFFEIGLGSGLRNRLAESLAVKDYKMARIYVSTTYATLSAVSVFLVIITILSSSYIDWTKVFNTEQTMLNELVVLVNIVFSLFFLQFVLKLIGIVLYADQKPAESNILGPLANLLSIAIIYILTKTTDGSLIYLGIALSLPPVIIMVVYSMILFSGRYKQISPSFSCVRIKYAGSLFSLGIKFFIIQVSGLVLYQSSNIIIAQYFGPAEVTPYNIAYKLFSTLNMVFSIVMVPFWSAYTEAWSKSDTAWIKRSIHKLLKIWLLMSAGGILVLLFSGQIYSVWVGSEIKIGFGLSALLLMYFIVFTYGGIFNMFINGVGKIKLQLYNAIFSALIFYPLTYILLTNFNMGINGLALSILLTNLSGPVIASIQYKRLISSSAKGIWNE